MRYYLCLILLLSILFSCTESKENVCVLQTNHGTMVFRFFEADAPNTCEQFKKLVNDSLYDGQSFYRVVKGHVIQTGAKGDNHPNIKAEFNDNLHIVGAVGLARSKDPDSGSTTFYICLAPRSHLDGNYTLFGQLIEGFDVLEQIGNVEVEERFVGEAKVAFHKPLEPVVIEKAFLEKREVK